MPNSDTCYIQLPEDITSLLDDSAVLNIKYILSSGESGNIKANTLTQFEEALMTTNTDGDEVEVTNQVRIIQAKGTIDGVDPETLDNAYRNYKKTVGTFNTLVTRKDYENFAYNATVDSKNLVSNCVVADRTNDLNASTKVKVWTPNYDVEKVLIKTNSGEPMLNAYNIVLYALNPGDGTYDSTFEPNEDGLIQATLEAKVKDVKAIEHDFLSPIGFEKATDAIYYLYKNLYALNGKIVTYSKITATEAAEIEQKVIDALSVAYNARYVDFGEEPNYVDLIDTIQGADSRIKTVALDIPKYQIYHVAVAGVDGVNKDETSDNYYFTTPGENEKFQIVAKMILAGKTQLLKFDDSFDYDFGYRNIENICGDGVVKSITTEADITITPYTKSEVTFDQDSGFPVYNDSTHIDKSYTLKANESIQLFAPNYVTVTEYSTNVKYYLYVNTSSRPNVEETSTYIEANTDYAIKAGEFLKIQYTDEDGIVRTESLTQGTIINCTKDIPLTAQSCVTSQYYEIKKSNILTTTTKTSEAEDPVNYSSYWSPLYLYSGQSISVKKINKETLNKATNIYFITKNVVEADDGNKYCTLSLDSDNPRVLLEDEYLMYTNSNTDELFLLGSGTMLSVDSDKQIDLACLSVDVTDLTSTDVDEISWVELTTELTLTELNITTIGEDATIELVDINNTDARVVWCEKDIDSTSDTYEEYIPVVLDNSTRKLLNADGNIIVAKITDKSGSIVMLDTWIDDGGNYQPYWIQSRLSLNVTTNSAQYIGENQKVILYLDNTTSAKEEVTGKYITFSDSVIISGGSDIDAAVLNSSGQYAYTLQAYTYTKYDISGFDRENGIITLNGETKLHSLPFDFKNVSNTSIKGGSGWLLQLYYSQVTSDSSVNLYTSKYDMDDFIKTLESDSKLNETIDTSKIYYTSEILSNIASEVNSVDGSLIFKSDTSIFKALTNDSGTALSEDYCYVANESTLEFCKINGVVNSSSNAYYLEIANNKIYTLEDDDKIYLLTYTDYLKDGLQTDNTALTASGSYIMYVPTDNYDAVHNIFVEFSKNSDEFDVLSIGKINRFNGFNTDEINVTANDDNNYSSKDNFDITAKDTDTGNYKILDMIESIISGSDQPDAQFD